MPSTCPCSKITHHTPTLNQPQNPGKIHVYIFNNCTSPKYKYRVFKMTTSSFWCTWCMPNGFHLTIYESFLEVYECILHQVGRKSSGMGHLQIKEPYIISFSNHNDAPKCHSQPLNVPRWPKKFTNFAQNQPKILATLTTCGKIIKSMFSDVLWHSEFKSEVRVPKNSVVPEISKLLSLFVCDCTLFTVITTLETPMNM